MTASLTSIKTKAAVISIIVAIIAGEWLAVRRAWKEALQEKKKREAVELNYQGFIVEKNATVGDLNKDLSTYKTVNKELTEQITRLKSLHPGTKPTRVTHLETNNAGTPITPIQQRKCDKDCILTSKDKVSFNLDLVDSVTSNGNLVTIGTVTAFRLDAKPVEFAKASVDANRSWVKARPMTVEQVRPRLAAHAGALWTRAQGGGAYRCLPGSRGAPLGPFVAHGGPANRHGQRTRRSCGASMGMVEHDSI